MSGAAALSGGATPGLEALELQATDVRWGGQSALGARWASLVLAEHLIAAAARLDVSTGQPLSTPLLQALADIRTALGGGRWPLPRDGLARVIEFALDSLERIVSSPRWRPQRVRVRLQPEKVRQQDVKCLTWLARQPGVTLHEKSASARQVLGVIRQPNHDTPENRLVRRVLMALERLVLKRLKGCQGEFDEQAPALVQSLRRMQQLTRRELESSPMAGVMPSVRPEPNNVLLGDPDYSRAWRAFRWLGAREAQALRALEQADPRLTATLGAMVLAMIAGRRDVILENGLVDVELEGRANADFGLVMPSALMVTASTVERIGLVRAEASALAGWSFEQRSLSGGSILEQVEARTLTLTAAFLVDGELSPGRGHPARAVIRGGEGEESIGFFADTEGFRQVGRMIVDRWLGAEPEAAAVLLLPCEGTSGKKTALQVGWDISTPVLQIAAREEAPIERGLTLVGRPSSKERWFVGRDGLSLLGATPSLGCGGALAGVTEPGREQPSAEEARDALTALFRSAIESGAGPAAGGALAIAIPDDTDEVRENLLREALPAAQASALFVPSSVAAALEWRRRQAGALRPSEPEPVLVLNVQASGLTVSYLELQLDKESSSGTDPFMWQRALPLAPLAEARAASASAWERALARGAALRASRGALEEGRLHAVVARLVDGGLLMALLDDPSGRPVLVPLAEDGSRWLRIERHHVSAADAAPVWLEAFQSWAAALERSGGRAGLLAQVRGRPLTILMVGAPFQAALLQEQLRFELERCFSPSRVECVEGGAGALARGAREALARRERGEPTWSDTLPPLLLEISTQKGSEWIPLIEQGRAVRPGERVVVPVRQHFGLPQGERRITFPLSRDRSAGHVTAGFIATLTDETFPLKQGVKVRLEVDFRYAEDAFRVHVFPIGPAPFTALEFRWEAGAHDARKEISNEPPASPEVEWDEAAPEVEVFIQGVRELQAEGKKAFQGNPVTDVKDKELRKRFLERLRQLEPLVPAKALGIKDLWTSARRPGPPARVEKALQELVPRLMEFGGFKAPQGARKPEPLTKASLWSVPEVKKELEQLRAKAVETLGALRGDAPPSVLGELLTRARAASDSQYLLEALGRQLTSKDREAVRESLDWLAARIEPEASRRPQAFKLPLWALATGLWSTPSAVSALSPSTVSSLAASCEALMRRIAEEWHSERVRGDLFAETLAVLLGLLRLRPSVQEPRLIAGTPEAARLAAHIERADATLEREGKQVRSRLKLENEDRLSQVVCNALRGLRIVRVKALED